VQELKHVIQRYPRTNEALQAKEKLRKVAPPAPRAISIERTLLSAAVGFAFESRSLSAAALPSLLTFADRRCRYGRREVFGTITPPSIFESQNARPDAKGRAD